jgi:hypothetical protein
LKDIAELLHVAPYRITYLVTSRQVPEPRLRIGNTRVWTIPEILVIAEKMKIEIGQEVLAGKSTDGRIN